MNSMLAPSAAVAAAPLTTSTTAAPCIGRALVAAARLLLADIERGVRIGAPILRTAMISAFGGSDSEGAWDWKTAYDACEAAQILFLRKFGPAMRSRAGSPALLLAMLAKVASLLPTHTRRSEESQALHLGRNRAPGHPCRTGGRQARSERACRHARGAARAPLRRHRRHPA